MVGCAGLPDRMRRTRYFESLRFLETDLIAQARVKQSVLQRWRDETPEGCGFALLATHSVTHDSEPGAGHFRDSEVVRAGLVATQRAAETLGAEVVVFRTPPSFTPSVRNRDAMARLFASDTGRALAAAHTLVWSADGLWQPAAAAAHAEQLGMLLAIDPSSTEAPPVLGNRAYFRVSGLGSARRGLREDQLEAIAAEVSGLERAWVVFANPDRFRDAQRFDKLIRT
jgi:uncharacterized protein YecE (DUF72 family)